MKNNLFVKIKQLLFGVANSKYSDSDWRKDGLRGKVKILNVNGVITTYNQHGLLLSTISGTGDYYEGEVHYNYDENGRLVEDICFNCCKEEDYRYIYQYDETGLLKSAELREQLGSEVTKYEYNSNKQLCCLKKYSEDNQLILAEEYLYDLEGNQIRVNTYDSMMTLYSYTERDFDDNHKLKEQREFSVSDTTHPAKISKYNNQGRLNNEITYHDGKPQTQLKISYNKLGNITKEEVVKYKSYPDLITKDEYIYDYLYDKQGNWLTLNEYHNGSFYKKFERVLTYYQA